MKMMHFKEFVKEYRKDSQELAYDVLLENQFKPVKGTFEKSLGLMGEEQNKESLYILAVAKKGDSDNAVLLTTKQTYNLARVEVQNMTTQLETNFGFINIELLYCKPNVIVSMSQDGLNGDSEDNSKTANGDSAPIRKLKQIVVQALQADASDIHLYIKPDAAYYNFRVDGILTKNISLNRVEGKEMISAGLSTLSDDFKGMVEDDQTANVNIYLTVEPEDENGLKQKPIKVRLRTSKNDAYDGISVTFRVIPVNRQKYASLDELGLPADIIADLDAISHSGSGLFLMTGPTGSGKSTTLAGFYESIDPLKKVVMIEDPVEYILHRPNVTQQQVMDKDGQRLVDRIESALRQDPDVVGISEIRSESVAEMAIRTALTGHMIVSTMHTNDAISSITRLNDLKIPLVTLSKKNLLRGVMAQRLIPRLCEHCKVAQFKHTQFPKERFGNVHLKHEHGCKHCDFRGTKGRIIIAELIHIDAPARKYILEDRFEDWEAALKKQGWQSMYDRIMPFIQRGEVDPYTAAHFVNGLMTSEDDVHQYTKVETDATPEVKTNA